MTMTMQDSPLGGIHMSSALDALQRAQREFERALVIDPVLFEERRDQELNAIVAASLVCDWIFSELPPKTRQELARRYLGEGQVVDESGHLAHLLAANVRPFKLARSVANALKHRYIKSPRSFTATSSVGAYTTLDAANGAPARRKIYYFKIVDNVTGERHRAAKIAADLILFWDDFFC